MSAKRRMRVVQARWAFVEDLAHEVEWRIHETGKAIYFVSPDKANG